MLETHKGKQLKTSLAKSSIPLNIFFVVYNCLNSAMYNNYLTTLLAIYRYFRVFYSVTWSSQLLGVNLEASNAS